MRLKNIAPTKPIIVSSHYPLVCSGKKGSCQEMEVILRKFHEFIINKAVIYLGAHWHSY